MDMWGETGARGLGVEWEGLFFTVSNTTVAPTGRGCRAENEIHNPSRLTIAFSRTGGG